jgi:hypothetical protein
MQVRKRTPVVLSLAMVATLMTTIGPATVQAQSAAGREEFTATAVNLGGPRSESGTTPVDITIERWSSAAEGQRLIETLKGKGADAMLDVLRDQKPVGTIQVPGNLAYDLRYAHQEQLPDGGRRIVLATDRPMSHWEIASQPRSAQYPFTFIELRVNRQGEGEGKLALATKIDVSPGGQFLELVNYAVQPVHLNNVRKRDGS